MFRIEIVGAFDPQVIELGDNYVSTLMGGRTRIHSRAPGFISALRGYGALINEAITTQNLFIDDPEVVAYFEICRVFHAGGAVVFHNV